MKEYAKSLFSGLFIGLGLGITIALSEAVSTLISLKELKSDLTTCKEIIMDYKDGSRVCIEKEVKIK